MWTTAASFSPRLQDVSASNNYSTVPTSWRRLFLKTHRIVRCGTKCPHTNHSTSPADDGGFPVESSSSQLVAARYRVLGLPKSQQPICDSQSLLIGLLPWKFPCCTLGPSMYCTWTESLLTGGVCSISPSDLDMFTAALGTAHASHCCPLIWWGEADHVLFYPCI